MPFGKDAVVYGGERIVALGDLGNKFSIALGNALLSIDYLGQPVESLEVLGETLSGIFLRLAGGDEERPIAALEQKELPRGLVKDGEDVSLGRGIARNQFLHAAFRGMDRRPHPLGIDVEPGEMSAAGAALSGFVVGGVVCVWAWTAGARDRPVAARVMAQKPIVDFMLVFLF